MPSKAAKDYSIAWKEAVLQKHGDNERVRAHPVLGLFFLIPSVSSRRHRICVRYSSVIACVYKVKRERTP